jgi:hypothetical protein
VGSDGDTDASIDGVWSSSFGDGFAVSGTAFTQYDDAEKTVSFAGTIVHGSDKTDAAGFLTVKITAAGTWFKTPDSYLVIRWKSLAADTVQEAAPSKYLGEDNPGNDFAPGKPTQAEAESTYTEANGYYAQFGTYTKKK